MRVSLVAVRKMTLANKGTAADFVGARRTIRCLLEASFSAPQGAFEATT